ncbi:GrpB family protein [Lysinibacillus xylanilyticus]|uniref:GrpB family protein n=1 Tax=Lysinibacillus xylanilyticus TaxID=582475 RepID=UPI0037FD0F98
MDKEITIEDYNSNWFKQFEVEKFRLKEILADKVISIEHIGNRFVESLGAKPILNIAIGVNNLEVVSDFIEPLKQIGYEIISLNLKKYPKFLLIIILYN